MKIFIYRKVIIAASKICLTFFFHYTVIFKLERAFIFAKIYHYSASTNPQSKPIEIQLEEQIYLKSVALSKLKRLTSGSASATQQKMHRKHREKQGPPAAH